VLDPSGTLRQGHSGTIARTWAPIVLWRLGVMLGGYLIAFVVAAAPMGGNGLIWVFFHHLLAQGRPLIRTIGIHPSEGYAAYLASAAFLALALSNPLLAYNGLACTLAPLLQPRRPRLLVASLTSLAFLVGAALADVLVPLAMTGAANLERSPEGLSQMIWFESYVRLMAGTLAWGGLALEVPLLVWALVHYGVLAAHALRRVSGLALGVGVLVAVGWWPVPWWLLRPIGGFFVGIPLELTIAFLRRRSA
jgi:Sec-independent protein secretion pathway component TatC